MGIPSVNHFAFLNQQSLLFDGVDEFVDIGSTPDIQFDGANPFSLSCWAKMDAAVGEVSLALLSNIGVGPTNTGVFLGRASAGLLQFQIAADQGTNDQIGIQTVGPAVDEWFHVAVTYDGVDRAGITLYLNGAALVPSALIGQAALVGPSTTGVSWEIGGPASAPTFSTWDGNIDEVSFHGVELSAAQVATLFNGGRPLNVVSYASTLHFYRMGDRVSEFPTVPDMISGLDGTMTNMEAGDIVEDVPT